MVSLMSMYLLAILCLELYINRYAENSLLLRCKWLEELILLKGSSGEFAVYLHMPGSVLGVWVCTHASGDCWGWCAWLSLLFRVRVSLLYWCGYPIRCGYRLVWLSLLCRVRASLLQWIAVTLQHCKWEVQNHSWFMSHLIALSLCF